MKRMSQHTEIEGWVHLWYVHMECNVFSTTNAWWHFFFCVWNKWCVRSVLSYWFSYVVPMSSPNTKCHILWSNCLEGIDSVSNWSWTIKEKRGTEGSFLFFSFFALWTITFQCVLWIFVQIIKKKIMKVG